MFGWFRKKRRRQAWKLEHLEDFAEVVRWLEEQRRQGRIEQAITYYGQQILPVLIDNIENYLQQVAHLDDLAGGIYSDPTSGQRPGLKLPPNCGILTGIQNIGRELTGQFRQLLDQPRADFLPAWQDLIDEPRQYLTLLQRLVGEMGCFEILLPMLPGTGPTVIDQRLQTCLDEMYRINMCNLRSLEMIHDISRSWREDPERPDFGFFQPQTELADIVNGMIGEYMLQADPVRIQTRKESARRENKPFHPYRFWRAAENLRLMADVAYVDGAKRKPTPQRRYIQTRLDKLLPMTVDTRRMEWAIREIFNNSLSASSRMFAKPGGAWEAHPLPRHDTKDPKPAIELELHKAPPDHLRLTLLDEGVGIDPDDLPYVTYWAYSPRRQEFREKAKRNEITATTAQQEIQIGGKGIGLGYANAVTREHGGQLHLTSRPGMGTCVIMEFPIPLPLPI